MNTQEDIRIVLRQKGYFRQEDGSYSKAAPVESSPAGADHDDDDRHDGRNVQSAARGMAQDAS